jgi:protein ImuA
MHVPGSSQPIEGQAERIPQTIAALRRQISHWEGHGRPVDERPVSTACVALDRLLPHGGLVRGTVIEWLAGSEGGGAESLAFQAAREACRGVGALVVIDRRREFYPPAALRLGLAPQQIVVVQPTTRNDFIWALDQALRCPAAAATLAWVDQLDGHAFRRFQLAAEQAATLGLLVRPADARHEPSWADVRLLVEPFPSADVDGRRLHIELLRCRGGAGGQRIEVVLDHETRGVHLGRGEERLQGTGDRLQGRGYRGQVAGSGRGRDVQGVA